MNYTIEDFWKTRLPARQSVENIAMEGWDSNVSQLSTFQEAPLALSELSEEDPKSTPILLISAPGAVGKSTLSKQIASVTGAVYIDLARAAPVGGNVITGGLVKTGMLDLWKEEKIALLIDGLDEARLRVTQESFISFLEDIAQLSLSRTVPIVLFGRTGAIQDAWVVLQDKQTKSAILEIGYYSSDSAVNFTMAQVYAKHPDRSYETAQRKAAKLLIERLKEETTADGDRFAGYAPVLQAVAHKMMQEKNCATLISEIEKGVQPVTLQTVVSSIMERERNKLDTLRFEDELLIKTLYQPEEQLQRLTARIYKTPIPALPSMSARDTQTYSAALETWVAEHPFLNGAFEASSAVFDAFIAAHALKHLTSDVALKRELCRETAANPFLAEFYLPQNDDNENREILPEHIGIIYASMRAGLSLDDRAGLIIDGAEETEGNAALTAAIEITVVRKDQEKKVVKALNTDQTGTVFLGNHIADVNISIPYGKVEIGPGREATFVAPVNIQCDELIITTKAVIAEAIPSIRDTIIFLEANKFKGLEVTSVPTLRGGAKLSVYWSDAKNYPWTSFVSTPLPPQDPKIEEALRRFRKFVISFRSHSKGELARFKDKIEHDRMTKGTGRAVLDHMIKEKILYLKGAGDPMYILDPELLGRKTGATYSQCMAREFKQETIEFVKQALGITNNPKMEGNRKAVGAVELATS